MSPIVVVIFGGAGDLTWRKLVPSIYDLYRDGRMPERYAIIAVDRVPNRDVELRRRFLDGVKRFSRTGRVTTSGWSTFSRHITYLQGDFQDPATYSNLQKRCAELDNGWRVKAGRIFHLAIPPVMVGVIPKMLVNAGLNRDRVNDRIVVEKPIGHDLVEGFATLPLMMAMEATLVRWRVSCSSR